MFKYILQVVICIFCSISIFGQTTITIGTQSTETSAAAFVATPYNYYIESRRVQILYTAAEIIAAGGSAGTISSLAWDVSQVNGGNLLNYTINMANTASANLSAHDATGSTTVLNATTLTPGSTGWRTITFDTPFSWNGTSNLLIDVCWGVNSGWAGSGKIWLYDTGSSNVMRGIDDLSTTRCGVSTTATATGKPRIQLTITPALPSITTSAVSSIAVTSATGNATISSIGGSAVTTSGVCWNTSTTPTIANSKTTDGATTATSFTTSITGLTAQTYYYLRAYATNSGGTAYGSEVNFWTLSSEPSGHSAAFTAVLNGSSQIDLTFSAASGYGADGYIILRRNGSAPTSGGVVDGSAPGSLTLSDATLVTTITNNATTSFSNTDLTGGITYHYAIIPYNYNGANNETYNYYIGGTIPTANATTPEFYSAKGISIAGNFTNDGTFVQTNDGNYFSMTGASKSFTGSGTFTDAKVYVDGTITYDGSTASYMQKTMVNTAKTFTISNNKTYHNELMTINGTLVISATSSEIKNSGNWSNNGTLTANTGSLVTFDGTSSLTTGGNGAGKAFYNVTLNGISATLDGNIDVNNNFTLTSGTWDVSGSNYSMNVGGNWSNSGTFTSQSGTVTFDGTANQSITGASTTTFYNLTNSNSSTGLTLNRGIVVTNTLAMSGATADIDLNGYNIDLSSTGNITGESNTDRIYGASGIITTTRDISAPSTLNVGGMGAVLTSSTNMGSTTLYRGHAPQTNGSEISIARYFSISPTTNTGLNATLEMSYFDNELGAHTESNLALYRSTDAGSTWTYRGGTVDAGANTITLSGIDAFSLWTPSDQVVEPLPIELLSFTGIKEDNLNLLQWTTASEKNNDYFTVEKTADGNEFHEIGTREGAGNSIFLNSYTLYDFQVEQIINYYRLKQTDFDGKFTYSNLISIDNRIGVDTNRKLLKITNTLGQEIGETYVGIVIYIYSDGTIERKFNY